MGGQQEKRMLRHLHRGFIAGLSLLGMVIDGLQLSDLFLQGAALIWLWAPELQVLESAGWRRLHRHNADAAPLRSHRSARRTVARI